MNSDKVMKSLNLDNRANDLLNKLRLASKITMNGKNASQVREIIVKQELEALVRRVFVEVARELAKEDKI